MIDPFGRAITLAFAACTALPAAPSDTLTLEEQVSVPETPPGAVELFVASAAAPTTV